MPLRIDATIIMLPNDPQYGLQISMTLCGIERKGIGCRIIAIIGCNHNRSSNQLLLINLWMGVCGEKDFCDTYAMPT